MATGHLDPGYGDYLGSMKRYSSGYRADTETDLRESELGSRANTYVDFNAIKNKARDVWLRPDISLTSYGDHYQDRFYDVDEPTKTRPTSAQRKNKPHPPLVFLATRLHSVPGYHNPDAVLGKDIYRVDASVNYDEQLRRQHLKSKYIGRPSSAAVNQFREDEELNHITDPVEKQATKAWIKLANDKKKENLVKDGHIRIPGPAMVRTYRPHTVPSLHRYLREAGAGEAEELNIINEKAARGHYRPQTRQNPFTINIGERKYRDIEKTRTPKYTHRSKRGDFLMHPEWPPNFTQHRLNGLSSADLPYIPGKR